MVAVAIGGAAIVGAGASVVAGNKAAKAQKSAAGMQVAEERRQYDQTRADFEPWRESGKKALTTLEQLYGLAPTPAGVATPFDMVKATPGYEFRKSEGLKAVERSAASRGLLKSGTALKAVDRFADGLASSEYEALAGRLAGLAGVGQAATGSTAAAGADAAHNISAAYGRSGDASASAYLNTGQAINQGIQNIASAYLWQQGQKAPLPSGGKWI